MREEFRQQPVAIPQTASITFADVVPQQRAEVHPLPSIAIEPCILPTGAGGGDEVVLYYDHDDMVARNKPSASKASAVVDVQPQMEVRRVLRPDLQNYIDLTDPKRGIGNLNQGESEVFFVFDRYWFVYWRLKSIKFIKIHCFASKFCKLPIGFSCTLLTLI